MEKKMTDNMESCLIFGDLNGRTKQDDDFVRDSNDDHSPINIIPYAKDEQLCRANVD